MPPSRVDPGGDLPLAIQVIDAARGFPGGDILAGVALQPGIERQSRKAVTAGRKDQLPGFLEGLVAGFTAIRPDLPPLAAQRDRRLEIGCRGNIQAKIIPLANRLRGDRQEGRVGALFPGAMQI